MAKFVLIAHKHIGTDPETGQRRTFRKGDTIELTDSQAVAFADKFKALEVVEAEAAVATAAAEAAKRMAAKQAEKDKDKQTTPQTSTAS